MKENALFSGKIYAAGKKFTRPLVMALTTNFNSANKMIATRNITNKIITTVDMIYKKTTRSTRAKRPPQKRSPCSRPGTQISCVVAPLTRLRWWFFLQLVKPAGKSSDHPNSFWSFIKTLARQNSDNENKIRWRNHAQLAQLWSLNPLGSEWKLFPWSLKKRGGGKSRL